VGAFGVRLTGCGVRCALGVRCVHGGVRCAHVRLTIGWKLVWNPATLAYSGHGGV
jgi:hypothetical protein